MGELTERLAGIDLHVTTPDDIATAHLRGWTDVSVSLTPGYYAHTSAERAYWRAMSDTVGYDVQGPAVPPPPGDPLAEGRDSLVAEGESADGRVQATTVALRSWTFTLARDVTSELDEAAFCAAESQALSQTLVDHAERLVDLSIGKGRDLDPRARAILRQVLGNVV
jgi:hypothetical protein